MKRKTFVKNLCLIAFAGAGTSQVLSGCSSMARISGHLVEGELRRDGLYLPLSAFEKEKKKLQYVVVYQEELKFPIYVYRYGVHDYEALWMECTHQGAELQAFDNKLECPAHGSEFNQRGQVLNGPADTDLKTFETKVSGKHLIIQLV